MEPEELIESAREVLDGRTPPGAWPRASAFLARQALESVLDEYWRERWPGVERASRATQLLCLRYLLDPALAADASLAWHALSRACHHHAYELAPVSEELDVWIRQVDGVIMRIRAASPGGAPSPGPAARPDDPAG